MSDPRDEKSPARPRSELQHYVSPAPFDPYSIEAMTKE